MGKENVNRFSGRADNYDKYRPTYPEALFLYIHSHLDLNPDAVIADVAAGTGIFTEQVAKWGLDLYAVEPNEAMIAKAKARLDSFTNISFVSASAEDLQLDADTVDLFLCAQAFHWFDLAEAKAEFTRVGKEGSHLAVVWNWRNMDSAFEQAYETFLIEFGDRYLEVSQKRLKDADMRQFFEPFPVDYEIFTHTDILNYEQYIGRTLSYSYLPDLRSPRFEPMMDRLNQIFETYAVDGQYVSLSYLTKLYLGRLK